jgi:excinuclease ABC subunit C
MFKLDKLPHLPGCYIFKDRLGNVLYIGKARDLRKRVSSYFQKKEHDPKTQRMLERAASVDTFVTGNEREAFLLENNLIKRHRPKYNISLRDSKRYAWLLLTREEFPRLAVARRKEEIGAYFGPFPSAEERDSILKFAVNVFRLRTCRRLPKRPCLRLHLGLCTAPCKRLVSKEEYNLQVEDARKLLSGKNSQLLSDLKARMALHARNKDYERAQMLRDRIRAIESLNEQQSVETAREYDQDIVNYIISGPTVRLAVFKAKKGVLSGKSEFEFERSEGFLEEFLSRYYSEEKVPRELILPERLSEGLAGYLAERRGSPVSATVPSRGEKKILLELVVRNLEASFRERELSVSDLQEKLGLARPPEVIECFDVSHLSGTSSVGSMARFAGGKPDKSGYRRFRIKSIEGVDDYAMMGELVRRRYSRLKDEGHVMPDLIVLDGGVGQLSAALVELKKLGLSIPALALAKKTEEVYLPGIQNPLRFDLKSRGMKLLQNARDEAHRFALAYHKLLRSKRAFRKE